MPHNLRSTPPPKLTLYIHVQVLYMYIHTVNVYVHVHVHAGIHTWNKTHHVFIHSQDQAHMTLQDSVGSSSALLSSSGRELRDTY